MSNLENKLDKLRHACRQISENLDQINADIDGADPKYLKDCDNILSRAGFNLNLVFNILECFICSKEK